MKQILFSLTLLLFFGKSLSQTPTFEKDYFLKKSKTQKTVGWVMLGGGVAMTTIGILISNKKEDDILNRLGNKGLGVLLEGVGIATALGSILFFTSSAKNTRNAATISLTNQKVLFPQQNTFVLRTQPTLVFKIEL
jgi:hypothetical protein